MYIAHADAPPAPVAQAPTRSVRVERATFPEHTEKRRDTPFHASSHAHPGVHPENDRANGVLRHLEEGHFKGVADVRLRIQFHEELRHRQQEKVHEVVQDGLATLTATVAAHADTLSPSGILSDEQAEGFKELFAAFEVDVRESGKASEASSLDQLVHAVQDSFEALYAGLQALLPSETPAPETAPLVLEDPAQAVEKVDHETPDDAAFSDFLNGLAEVFTRALDDLQSAVHDADVLPPLSKPTGHGRAYDKFVAQYMRFQTSPLSFGVPSFESQA